MDYTLERVDDMMLDVRVPYHRLNESFHHFICSDLHLDNTKCDRGLLLEHLQEAKNRGAFIQMHGDILDLMQGKGDRRSNKSALMSEHKIGSYIDGAIYEAAEFLDPFKENIIVISDGNHETSVLNKLETDPLARLCDLLRREGAQVEHMPYVGFVRYIFRQTFGGMGRSLTVFFAHGHWGGIITKGTMAAERYVGIAPQADVYYAGHTHDRNMIEKVQYRYSQRGKIQMYPIVYIKGGTYKEEFAKGSGWAVEKIAMPKNIGGWWMTSTLTKSGVKKDFIMA